MRCDLTSTACIAHRDRTMSYPLPISWDGRGRTPPERAFSCEISDVAAPAGLACGLLYRPPENDSDLTPWRKWRG